MTGKRKGSTPGPAKRGPAKSTKAATAKAARRWSSSAQPTTRRLKASRITAKNANSSRSRR